MLRVIQDVRPRWVIGENVSGLLSFNKGLLFDGIITDLEAAGYETGTFVLPACSQDAPHRRDRVWVVAHTKCDGSGSRWTERERQQRGAALVSASGDVGDAGHTSAGRRGGRQDKTLHEGQGRMEGLRHGSCLDPWYDSDWLIGHDGKARRVPSSTVADTDRKSREQGWKGEHGEQPRHREGVQGGDRAFRLTQPPFCQLADGGPSEYDNENITLLVETFKHRADFLKMLGNSIVWPVVVPIMEAIRDAET